MTVLEQLLSEGLIEAVTRDSHTAHLWLGDADQHLEAARVISDIDKAGSYVLAYDAARKAISALLLAQGYRMRSIPGAHRAIARYAASLAAENSALAHFDDMRRNRNRSEYGVHYFGEREVAQGIESARLIVEYAHGSLDK